MCSPVASKSHLHQKPLQSMVVPNLHFHYTSYCSYICPTAYSMHICNVTLAKFYIVILVVYKFKYRVPAFFISEPSIFTSSIYRICCHARIVCIPVFQHHHSCCSIQLFPSLSTVPYQTIT